MGGKPGDMKRSDLEALVKKLRAANARLEDKNSALEAERSELQGEIAELEDRLYELEGGYRRYSCHRCGEAMGYRVETVCQGCELEELRQKAA